MRKRVHYANIALAGPVWVPVRICTHDTKARPPLILSPSVAGLRVACQSYEYDSDSAQRNCFYLVLKRKHLPLSYLLMTGYILLKAVVPDQPEDELSQMATFLCIVPRSLIIVQNL